MSAAADLPCLRVYADEMRVALMRAVLLAGLVAPGGGCTKHDAPAPNPVATASAPTVPSSAPAPVEDGMPHIGDAERPQGTATPGGHK